MARLQVGLPDLVSDIAKYANKYDMVELRPEPGAVPKPGTLRNWRKAVNPSFTFSVVLPEIVGRLAMTKAMDAALAEALEVAKVVEARCIVLSTPAEVRPTSATAAKLKTLIDKLPRPGVVLCWEPHGIWERPEVLTLAKQLGVLAVLDAAQMPVPPGPVVYTRLRALGTHGSVSQKALESISVQLAGRRDAWVVVEHRPSAQRVRTELTAALARNMGVPGPTVVRPAPGRLRADDEEQ